MSYLDCPFREVKIPKDLYFGESSLLCIDVKHTYFLNIAKPILFCWLYLMKYRNRRDYVFFSRMEYKFLKSGNIFLPLFVFLSDWQVLMGAWHSKLCLCSMVSDGKVSRSFSNGRLSQCKNLCHSLQFGGTEPPTHSNPFLD